MADEQALGPGCTTRPKRSGGLRLSRLVRRERGQALVEFAIVLPLLLLLVLGVVDFGLAYNYKNDQTSLANQALRYAVVNHCDPCAVNQTIEQYIPTTADSPQLENGGSGWGIQTPGVQVSICRPKLADGVTDSPATVGQPIEAVATSQYDWLPFLNLGNVTIQSTAIGRVEPGADYVPGGHNAYNAIINPC